jgi:hypothetical protein
MSTLKERHDHLYGVNDDGDVVPLEDYDLDRPLTDNESIAQGTANLQNHRINEELLAEDTILAKKAREAKVAQAAMENPGVFVTYQEHMANLRMLADAMSDISMYQGGEKGGYQTQDFQERYAPRAANVEAGARVNHSKVANQVIARAYKAEELIAAGFDKQDVEDDVIAMRIQLKRKYAGPQNKKARAAWRKSLYDK